VRLSGPTLAPLAITAVELWLPEHRDTPEAALAAGRLDQETAERLGYLEVAESQDRAAPEMAVLAATKAMADAGWAGPDLDLLVHAWTYHQGHDFWSPASYVAHQLGAINTVAIGIQQMCNGGAAALEVAVSRMLADPSVTRAAITTADRFAAPAFDRWRGDYDLAYGDGATALLVDRTAGPYRLLSIASVSRADFEVMHRGDASFSASAGLAASIDVRAAKRAFMQAGAEPIFAAALVEAVVSVVRQAIDEAGLAPDDPRVRVFTLPRLGTSTLAEFFEPAIRALGLPHAQVLDLGRRSGHLGAGDSAANLAELHSSQRLGSGEVALLLSLGGGFTWSCIAVQAD
jgi:3-oxoacyl-[acyl-carrier-protein] synthase III